MNEYLPEDIAILQVEQVDGRFHSRLNAKSKTYEYRIYKGSKPDVFERRYVWPMEEKIRRGENKRGSEISDRDT